MSILQHNKFQYVRYFKQH